MISIEFDTKRVSMKAPGLNQDISSCISWQCLLTSLEIPRTHAWRSVPAGVHYDWPGSYALATKQGYIMIGLAFMHWPP